MSADWSRSFVGARPPSARVRQTRSRTPRIVVASIHSASLALGQAGRSGGRLVHAAFSRGGEHGGDRTQAP